jgi:uncharacterized protein involved in exopolysaccharide biosynthesis
MTEFQRQRLAPAGDDVSLLPLATALLRRRRLIATVGLVGAVAGLIVGLRTPRQFTSTATFVPQTSEGSQAQGLAAAVTQLGIRIPGSGNTWGPPIYVALLRTREILEPVALDTLTVAETGARTTLADLLGITGPAARRGELAADELADLVIPSETKTFSGVRVTVTTKWASVSQVLAERLLRQLDAFSLQTRKSQATPERRFVEAQANDAERQLREAEDRLQAFLQANRATGSPTLTFQQDRLQREVSLRQQAYTSLVVSLSEARIREIRDTPAITVLEPPRLALVPERRNLPLRTVAGGMAAAVIAILFVLFQQASASARTSSDDATREFFAVLKESTPRLRSRVER